MGLTKEVLAEGNGPTPTKGASVTDCDLQQKFWSTKDPGQTPFTFNVGLGQVIKGWDEGVLGMKLGEQARLTCTPDYAYGAGGFPAWGYPFPPISYMDLGFRCTIQPNSTLIFEIEVLKIE
ncbi:Peptidyl-prolyl cis-trans isomerase, FKBP-type [Phytophthora cactorum]|nr:Peptidyl-prolyl cis-trans isomerase, FKBP-type [Phytophthora cactorum]